MTITFKIQRFHDGKQWTQDYSFPTEKGMTVLAALIKIKETVDPTLTFAASCRSSICGACGLRVNGNAVLACETLVDDMVKRYQSETLTIAPLANFTVLRDLMVDWQPKYERLKKIKPALQPKDEFSLADGCKQSKEEFNKISKNSECILCGSCVSECNKCTLDSSDFLDPFIFARAQKFVVDSRDKDAVAHLEPAVTDGLWKCMNCQECTTKCPKGLDPAEDIAKLRIATFKNKFKSNEGSNHAQAFYDDVNETGRLEEAQLALKTEGLKAAFRVPLAYRLLRVGKLAPLETAEPIPEIEKVRTIMTAAKEEKA
ncbi:8-methylmenaquinol:fumarate reductase iron-sulfur subunit [Sporomusa silvacetica DSM 10669]|uniref:Fumarate reductase iron-sulfur subunit n=1 Tax=Sporomusa silvacetica DSM 10669 TaxID=1123289 RepID=A0ABZ3ISN6_9FIRM|nr:succinate dehydrogenase/fumarate reductase iron-sulfur subunit [Sporomusa silvacetica]OZC19433.1 succinate dehydrogenase iron-sulfur subunit [Sporomusa silvacetica DSM 10669]